MNQMEQTIKQFEHQLWKRHNLEKLGEMIPVTSTEDMHDCDEYVFSNYKFSKPTDIDY